MKKMDEEFESPKVKMSQKLPSLEELRGIEKKAHDKWKKESEDSIKEKSDGSPTS